MHVQATGQWQIFYDIHSSEKYNINMSSHLSVWVWAGAVSEKKIFKILLLWSYTEKWFNHMFAILTDRTIWTELISPK